MGLSKAYDELTDNPEFTKGLTISTGNSIRDSDGVIRFGVKDAYTEIGSASGRDDNDARIVVRDGTYIGFFAQGNTPIEILDDEGNFTAVEYNATANRPGTLNLTNADLDVRGNRVRFDTDGMYTESRSTTYVANGTTQDLTNVGSGSLDQGMVLLSARSQSSSSNWAVLLVVSSSVIEVVASANTLTNDPTFSRTNATIEITHTDNSETFEVDIMPVVSNF